MHLFKETFFCFLIFQGLWSFTTATNGLDVSVAVSESNWECAVKNGYKFAIVRVYQSSGNIDPNGARTIKNAKDAGVEYVDGYIFPCYKCGDPAGQVRATVDSLRSNGAKFGQLWIDVEGPEYWSNKAKNNVDFVGSMVKQAKSMKVAVGIYTSESQWQPIAGNTREFSDLQLWYAHYDNKATFADFSPFGGWNKPAIKQYHGTTSVCGFGVDKNWYP